MKKSTILLTVLLCICILLSACNEGHSQIQDPGAAADTPTNDTTDSGTQDTEPTGGESEPTEPSSSSGETEPPKPVSLPEYIPGTIKLAARDAYTVWAPKDRQYRASYYLLMGAFADIVRKDRPDEYAQWKNEMDGALMRGEWKDEMLLVNYIKHFNISRENMEWALQQYIYYRTPLQLQTEFYEAPNLDIIYTFDNEIINHYYRYELAPSDPIPQSNLDPVTGLPIDVPEGFVYAIQNATEEAPADREYRLCYYNSDYIFMSLVIDRYDEVEAIRNERNEAIRQGTFKDEMWLVSIIKGLNIPREDFDKAIIEYRLRHDPEDQMMEADEMPNADILYTFDNEIINAYYRYEEPDWGFDLPELTENTEHLREYWTENGEEYYYFDRHLRYQNIKDFPYRSGYYTIWGEFLELANNRPGKSFDKWVKLRIAEGDSLKGCREAALVSFLKYFEIPKEDFEAALEKYILRHAPVLLTWDNYWILPDADIIYTFDNEIINEYYCYE